MRTTQATVLALLILFTPFFGKISLRKTDLTNHNLIDILKRKKLDSIFSAHHHANEPGSVLGIIKDGQIIYQNRLGMANLEHKLPITDSTLFNIASVSKQFTTYLVLHLQDEGKLSFQDDIRKHLPELKELPYKISIEQLTNHTHGLPNVDELSQVKAKPNMNTPEIINMLLNIKTINFKPGSYFQYNNTGYILLSEIIARAGKKPFTEQLGEIIFKPLGMNETKASIYRDDVIPNKAYSYRTISNGQFIESPIQLATIGSSGIYSSLRDMLIWAKNFQKIKVGKSEFYDQMQVTVVPSSGIPSHYGLGLEVNNYRGVDIVFHGGGTESYRSYILHAPEYNLSFVYLSNKRGMAGLDIVYNSLETIFPKGVLNKEKTPKKPSKIDMKSFEGTYEVYPGTYFTFIAENENLYWQVHGQKERYKLPSLDKNVFKDPFNPHSKFTFLDTRVDYQVADMVRHCYKIDLPKAPAYSTNELNKFTGLFKNQELDSRIEFVVKEGNLIAKRVNQYDIFLTPFTKNQFFSSEYFFGRIDFIINKKGMITGVKVSAQNLEDLVFIKE